MKERKSYFYNKVYRSGGARDQYFEEPEKSVYFPLWDEIIKRISPNSNLVDFGCGPGQFASLAFKRDINYLLGVDFSRTAIKMAKKINPENKSVFVKANLYNEDIYNKVSFDTCVLSEVLEHIERDLDVLSYIPSGVHALISLPSFTAKSHVRYFSSIEEIKERYKNHLDIKEITVPITIEKTGGKIFLIDSVVK